MAKFEKMKARRRKRKEAAAWSIAASAGKELQTKVDSESEGSDASPTADPPKKKPKLDRSSPRKLTSKRLEPTKPQPGDVSDKSRPKGQCFKSPKQPKVMGVMANSKRKKRKEVTISPTRPHRKSQNDAKFWLGSLTVDGPSVTRRGLLPQFYLSCTFSYY